MTEMPSGGKVHYTHGNMRTEFAWMYSLDAWHMNIYDYEHVSGADCVFIICPKGRVYLSAEGLQMTTGENPVSRALSLDIVSDLKKRNKSVFYIQEGPTWWFNEYELNDQINFYNFLANVDGIFAHNEHDTKFYKGLVDPKKVHVIPTLMIEETVRDLKRDRGLSYAKMENKCLIGGNMCHWYGGFQSYMVATEFNVPIHVHTSHAKREGEEQMENLTVIPRFIWTDWMRYIKDFKYAVHLMPTIAAGTFNLNCAYFGIPCIGNEKVDTQRICHPDLCVDIEDVEKAKSLARKLKNDQDFYNYCSRVCEENYMNHYHENVFKDKMEIVLSSYE
jgi:hypothetical protein